MKITEIIWEDDKKYIDKDGEIWTVKFCDLADEGGDLLSDIESLEYISNMNFEEVVDWSKVEVDTPIWVKFAGHKSLPRHFAEMRDGIVCVWFDGMTSHTTGTQQSIGDASAFLTKPEEE